MREKSDKLLVEFRFHWYEEVSNDDCISQPVTIQATAQIQINHFPALARRNGTYANVKIEPQRYPKIARSTVMS